MPPASDERLLDVLRGTEPAATALVTAEDSRKLTYGQLDEAVAALARRLSALGIGRGSRVALVPNGPDLVQLLLVIVALGDTAAPLNPAYKHDEYAFYLDDLEPRRSRSRR